MRDASNGLVGSGKRHMWIEISVSYYLFYILRFYLLVSIIPIRYLF